MGKFEERERLYATATAYHSCLTDIKVILLALEMFRPDTITDFHIKFLENLRDIFEKAHKELEDVIYATTEPKTE